MFPEIIEFQSAAPLVLKFVGSLAFGFYLFFAFVMVKQVNKMTETLEVGLETVIRALAYIHLLLALTALLAALFIL